MVRIIDEDVTMITNWEKGRCSPSRKYLGKVEGFLKMPFNPLISRVGSRG